MTAAIYLDYNAGAPLRPEARAAMLSALDLAGNPSSVHRFGRAVRRVVEEARAEVAALVGAAPGQIVFTGSATEANNMALAGAGGRVLASAVEHDSVLHAAAGRLPVMADGIIDLAALDRMVAAERPAVVAVMAVNNETGIVQPVAEAAAIARRHGALLHCDAAQAAGRLPVDVAALGCDTLSLSSHKLGGPQGVGALVVRDGLEPPLLLRGGGQERRRRAGTENVAGIAGFGAAARAAASQLPAFARLAAWRDGIERAVTESRPEVRLFGATAPRVANTTCIAMPGVLAETQLMALDLAGVAVSAGSACSSGKVAASHVLLAMGADRDLAASAIRVSLGWASRAEDADRFVAAWEALYRRVARPPAAA